MVQTIKEIKNFKEVLNDIHHNTWVILDLDNTVMTHQIELGGDAWFGGLFQHLAQQKLDLQTALPWIISVYNAMQHYVKTNPVEAPIVPIIKYLQNIGVPVVGLTARGLTIKDQTIRQLANIGIDFSKNAIVNSDSSYASGIIFCDGKNKGEKLNLFLSKLKKYPQHICMLDDKKPHLEHVMHNLQTLGVTFSGFRYGYLDDKVKKFDMQHANIQLAHLWEWLPDEIKQDILNLKLLTRTHQALKPEVYKDNFFSPETPLLTKMEQHNLPIKTLTRSNSSPSFFGNSKYTMLNHISSEGITENLESYKPKLT